MKLFSRGQPLPLPAISKEERIAETRTQVLSAFDKLKKELANSGSFSAIREIADKINQDTAAKIRDIEAVGRGLQHKDPDQTQTRQDTLISKLIADTNLFVGGDTKIFAEKLSGLIKATLEEQKLNAGSDPELKERKNLLYRDIENYLSADHRKFLIQRADNYRVALMDHSSAKGRAIILEPNQHLPENKIKYAANLLYEIALGIHRADL